MIYAVALGDRRGEARVIETVLWRVEACGDRRCVGAGGAGQGDDCSMSAGPKVEAGGRRVSGIIIKAVCGASSC